jgi:hypothetical protein
LEVVITESKKRLLSAEELYGILNRVDDEDFVLDIEAAREERAEEILNNNWMKKIGEVNKE